MRTVLAERPPWTRLPLAGGGTLYYRGCQWQLEPALATLAPLSPATGDAAGVLRRTLGGIDGAFAVVACWPDRVVAAVDGARAYPLFYHRGRRGITLTDDPLSRRAGLDLSVDDPLAAAEFQLAGYCGGEASTLSRQLKAVPAGCLVEIAPCAGPPGPQEEYGPETARVRRIAPPIQRPLMEPGEGEGLWRRMLECLDGVFAEYVEAVRGRQVVVPLSSGVDSRFIAAMLKRHGHRDVIAYCYGRESTWERGPSRHAAEHLGIPWRFVPYSRAAWRGWFESEPMREYLPFAGRHAAAPHVQDWPAVRALQHSGALDRNAVFWPGHTCMLISNRLERELFRRPASEWRRNLARSLFRHHYILQRPGRVVNNVEPLLQRIEAVLPDLSGGDPHRLLNAYFEFEARQRHAKMLINSARVYEFWGYDWAMPLWDRRVVDLWAGIGYEGRRGKQAFRTMLHYYNPQGLFPPPAPPGPQQAARQWLKENPYCYRALKPLKDLAHRTTGYFRDELDLGWYGVVPYHRYIYHMGARGDFYSLMSRLYLMRAEGG